MVSVIIEIDSHRVTEFETITGFDFKKKSDDFQGRTVVNSVSF